MLEFNAADPFPLLVPGVLQAFGLIVRRINDEPFDQASLPGSRAVTIRFIVPHARMGSVIGKQGTKIKEIQEASGARLTAGEAMLPGSTEVRETWRPEHSAESEQLMSSVLVACPQHLWCGRCSAHCRLLRWNDPPRAPRSHGQQPQLSSNGWSFANRWSSAFCRRISCCCRRRRSGSRLWLCWSNATGSCS